MTLKVLPVPISQIRVDEDAQGRKPLYGIAYARCYWKELLFWLCTISSCGVFLLFTYWFPSLYLFARFSKTNNLDDMLYIFLAHESGTVVVPVRSIEISQGEINTCICYKKDSKNEETGCSKVSSSDSSADTLVRTYIFQYLCEKYIYDHRSESFHLVRFSVDVPIVDIPKKYGLGISDPIIAAQRKRLYGAGCIEIPKPPLYVIVGVEISHPLFVFQILAFSLWFWDEYYAYASAIVILTLISLISEIYDTRLSANKLQEIAKYDIKQNVLENNVFVERNARDVLPGDVVQLTYGVVPCDMILLEGSILVNESMISGECIPVLKVPLKSLPHTEQQHFIKQRQNYQNLPYLLYGGTEIVQIKSVSACPVGLVMHTGFSTVQGHMMRTIMHPPTHRRNMFKEQTYKYLFVLLGVATVIACATLVISIRQNLHHEVVMIRFLDTFTNAIPALLPATMVIGALFAVKKLQKNFSVMCISPSKINVVGQVNTFVFDKTGTLTDDTYSVKGVITTNAVLAYDAIETNESLLMENKQQSKKVHQRQQLLEVPANKSSAAAAAAAAGASNFPKCFQGSAVSSEFVSIVDTQEQCPRVFLEAMACCQNLSALHDEIVGDLMEKQLLEFSQWEMQEKTITLQHKNIPTVAQLSTKTSRVYLVHRYEFSPDIKRMSVLTYNGDTDAYTVFCKGAPEELQVRCLPESLPASYYSVLQHYTKTGMRVISYGYKRLQPSATDDCDNNNPLKMSRDAIENNLIFLGFVVFINALKPEVREVITKLQNTGCRCIMATGDNPLTSIAVACESALVDASPGHLVLISQVEPQQESATTKKVSEEELDDGCNEKTSYMSSDDTTKTQSCQNKDLLLNNNKSQNFNSVATTDTDLIIRWKILQYSSDCFDKTTECCSSSNTNTDLINRNDDYEGQTSTPFSPPDYSSIKINDITTAATTTNEEPNRVASAGSPEQTSIDDDDDFGQLSYNKVVVPEGFLDSSQCASLANTATSTPALPTTAAAAVSAKCENSKNFTIKYSQQSERLLTCEEVVSLLNVQNVMKPKIILVLTGRALTLLGRNRDTLHEDYKIDLHYTNEQYYGKNKKTLSPSPSSSNYQKKSINTCSSDETTAVLSMSLFEYCLRKCRVFARMTPYDKTYLILELQKLSGEPLIGMCGDGANDCEALKTADVGVSLSGAVTSLSAPLTSQLRTIKSCYYILCEGRGALVNSFQNFKFVTLYALTELFATAFLFSYGGNLTDNQYLWIDLIIDLPLTMTMAWTYASEKLTSQLPLRRLIGPSVIFSLLGQIVIQTIYLVLGLTLVSRSSFYERFVPNPAIERFESEDLEGYENSVIFMLVTWQFIILSLVLSAGRPWRKSRWTNLFYVFTVACVMCLCGLVYVAYEVGEPFAEWLGVVEIPASFRGLMIFLVFLNLITSYIFEKYVIGFVAKYEMSCDQEKNCIDHINHFTIR